MNTILLSPIILCCAFFLVFRVSLMEVMTPSSSALQIRVLDVGQGDAIFIRSKYDKRILIDTGTDGDITLRALQSQLPPFDTRLDLIIITHQHNDHYGGLDTILSHMNIGGIVIGPSTRSLMEKSAIATKLKEKKIPVFIATSDQDLLLDPDTILDFLSPTSEAEIVKNENNNSVVVKLITSSTSALFTGDAEIPLELELIKRGYDVSSTILKGGHHGSKTSTSKLFLSMVAPEFVVFSNGVNNKFGHPSKEVLERLQEKQIPFWNTSISGTVMIDCTSTCIVNPKEHETL